MAFQPFVERPLPERTDMLLSVRTIYPVRSEGGREILLRLVFFAEPLTFCSHFNPLVHPLRLLYTKLSSLGKREILVSRSMWRVRVREERVHHEGLGRSVPVYGCF